MAISISLRVKSLGVDTSPEETTVAMFVGDAEANTSAFWPCWIEDASAELESKSKPTWVPGCAVVNCLPSVVNASVSEDAANTVIDPDNAPDPLVVAPAAAAVAPPACAPPEDEHEQITASAADTSTDGTDRRRTAHEDASSVLPVDTSTTTLVDLTAATARTPGFETEFVGGFAAHQRHDAVGPALQFHLRHHGVADDAGHQSDEAVTGRLARDRADVGTIPALLSANRARVAPSTTRRPAASVPVGSRPVSAHRRTVSSLTPSRSAASRSR